MTDHFLRFADEDEAITLLIDAGMLDEDRLPTVGPGEGIDLVGVLVSRPEYVQTGTQDINTFPDRYTDEDGVEHLGEPVVVTEPVYSAQPGAPLAGYHVNFRGELPEALTGYEVFPGNPLRVWG